MKILVIEARFYDKISDALLEGALDALQKAKAEITKVTVPGALEIPHVISMAEAAKSGFDGYVALGCVIRGETTHYDYVCQESARAIMALTMDGIPIGNGILTTENEDQALVRADPAQKNKGGEAAEAALALLNLVKRFAP